MPRPHDVVFREIDGELSVLRDQANLLAQNWETHDPSSIHVSCQTLVDLIAEIDFSTPVRDDRGRNVRRDVNDPDDRDGLAGVNRRLREERESELGTADGTHGTHSFDDRDTGFNASEPLSQAERERQDRERPTISKSANVFDATKPGVTQPNVTPNPTPAPGQPGGSPGAFVSTNQPGKPSTPNATPSKPKT